MWKLLQWSTASLFFSVAVVTATVQASSGSTSPSTSNAVNQNPVVPTAASQTRAKEIYGYDCSMCHGPLGRGKTDLGKETTGSVSDLTDPETTAHLSDQELHDLILNGKGKMPGEKKRVTDNEAWSLVTYIRGLSKEKQTIANDSSVH